MYLYGGGGMKSKDATITNKIIKERFVQELKNTELTYLEIGKRVGISASLLSQYKNTKKMPTLENFARICQVLELDANYILGLED